MKIIMGVEILLMLVDVSPTPLVNAGINFWMSFGESINLNGFTNASSYYWESSSWISCPTCLNPQINPTETTIYILNVTDSIGCINSDTVEVNIKVTYLYLIHLLPMEMVIMFI